MIHRPRQDRTFWLILPALAAVVIVVGVANRPAVTAAGVVAAIAAVAIMRAAVRRRDMAASRLLGDAISRLTAGDWQARVRLRGEDELGECGFRLNLLAERTAEQIAEFTRQVTDLTALVDSLPDAVLLADAQQRVVRINEPAANFLGINVRQAGGQLMVSLLGEAALVEMYEQALAAGDVKPTARDIAVTRLGQKLIYQAVAAKTAAGGVLIVLRDVTELAETVRMKTDFVANASHELRTPIAAIKIAFETLGDVVHDDPAQADRCMEIIAGHLRRLEEMLRDLLDLSRAETADARPDLGPVSGAGLLARVMNAMGSLAADKGVGLDVQTDGDVAFVSDAKLLDLVLKNLVENAVKYTPAGGRVTASIGRDDGGVVLRVVDTGVGIPPQHTERVFERFYQVDPARSGSSTGRGTGLGLAIVKHAIANLGGKVTLNSAVGRGTTVTCVVPDVAGIE